MESLQVATSMRRNLRELTQDFRAHIQHEEKVVFLLAETRLTKKAQLRVSKENAGDVKLPSASCAVSYRSLIYIFAEEKRCTHSTRVETAMSQSYLKGLVCRRFLVQAIFL